MTKRTDPAQVERYLGRDTPLPDLPAIGRSRRAAATEGLAPHCHEVFELCVIERGSVQWVHDDRPHLLGAGSVFFCRPGVVHGSAAGRFEPCGLRWLQFDHRRSPDRRLIARLRRVTAAAWTSADPDYLRSRHERLMDECRRPQPDSPSLARAVLTEMLIAVMREADGSDNTTTQARPPALQRAIDAIDHAPDRPWRIDDLTDEARVSRTHLHNLFKRHLGQSPGDYALRRRLRHAQSALRRTDQRITDIAMAHGFSSSQHFATAFRRAFGLTPRQCREQAGVMM